MSIPISIERVLPSDRETLDIVRAYLVEKWCISPEEVDHDYLGPISVNSLPAVWAARGPVRGAPPLGHAMLVVESESFLSIRREPWLQGVFVKKEWRGRGVGSALVRRAEEYCARYGYEYLYLDTVSACGFYERLGGWKMLGTDCWEATGETVTVMRKRVT